MTLAEWLRVQPCNSAQLKMTISGDEIGCRLTVNDVTWGWGRGATVEEAFLAAFDSDQAYSHRHIEKRRREWAEFMGPLTPLGAE